MTNVDEKANLKIEIPLNPDVILNIITTAHDAGSCNYFLMKQPAWLDAKWHNRMKADHSLWNTFEWELLIDDGSKGKVQKITFAKMCSGFQKMLMDEILGKYKNPNHQVADVVMCRDYGDSNFAQEVIQYAMYGKLIFA